MLLLQFQFPVAYCLLKGFLAGSVIKNPPANARDSGLIPGLGRSPGERNGHLLQYSCLENSMDRGAWRVTYSRWNCKELDITKQLSTHNV